MTHRGLINAVKSWLKIQKHWSIVVAELKTSAGEEPDIIAFKSSGGKSCLVECKVSRADFLADRDKIFRQFEEQGMGDERYFCAPKGLLNVDEIPEGWGLLEIHGSQRVGVTPSIHMKKEASHKTANKLKEVKFLVSVIRRLEISTAVYVIAESDIDSTPNTK
jgi:hypothetical protein